jgi:hypothetical protein
MKIYIHYTPKEVKQPNHFKELSGYLIRWIVIGLIILIIS